MTTGRGLGRRGKWGDHTESSPIVHHCHAERSEASHWTGGRRILHFVQDDHCKGMGWMKIVATDTSHGARGEVLFFWALLIQRANRRENPRFLRCITLKYPPRISPCAPLLPRNSQITLHLVSYASVSLVKMGAPPCRTPRESSGETITRSRGASAPWTHSRTSVDAIVYATIVPSTVAPAGRYGHNNSHIGAYP